MANNDQTQASVEQDLWFIIILVVFALTSLIMFCICLQRYYVYQVSQNEYKKSRMKLIYIKCPIIAKKPKIFTLPCHSTSAQKNHTSKFTKKNISRHFFSIPYKNEPSQPSSHRSLHAFHKRLLQKTPQSLKIRKIPNQPSN